MNIDMDDSSKFSSTFSLERFLPSVSLDDLECPPSPPIAKSHHSPNLNAFFASNQIERLHKSELNLNKTVINKSFHSSNITQNSNDYREKTNLKNGRYASLPPIVDINDLLQNISIIKPIKELKEEIPPNFNKIRLFLTYSLDSEDHYRNVIKICKSLESSQHFQVTMDAFDQESMAKDIYGWMNKSFKEADFIVPIISPLYKTATETTSDGVANEHIKQTKYIFGMIQREIYESHLKNKRIRPLYSSLTNANRSHVPYELSNTIIYQWPRESKEFISLLKKTIHVNQRINLKF